MMRSLVQALFAATGTCLRRAILQRVQQNHLAPSFFRFGEQDIQEASGRRVEDGAIQSLRWRLASAPLAFLARLDLLPLNALDSRRCSPLMESVLHPQPSAEAL
jgi:hypothetical protein